jgi:hypothetical protein
MGWGSNDYNPSREWFHGIGSHKRIPKERRSFFDVAQQNLSGTQISRYWLGNYLWKRCIWGMDTSAAEEVLM